MAEPLVLLPGLSTSAEVWGEVRARLGSIDCIAPEHPASASVDEIASAHLARLPERFSLAGFSFGGYVALAMAAAAPERIARLALVSTGAGSDSPEGRSNREKLIGLAREGRYETIDARMAPLLVHPDHRDLPAINATRSRMFASYGVERYVMHQRAAGARPSRVELLPRLELPVLVAVGREDRITPPALSEHIARAVPGAELVMLDRCGHLAPLEATAALASALARWMGRGTRKPETMKTN
jgi:pimeloyl-ACP methyl ester carboxylesterase